VAGACKPVHRGQEIRHSHPGVQHPNKISRGDALPLSDPQHFGDRAFYKLPVGLCRLSDIIHCPLYKALRFRKKRPDESDIPAQGVSKFPNSFRVLDHPAVQIVRTKFTQHLDFPHSDECSGTSLVKTAHFCRKSQLVLSLDEPVSSASTSYCPLE